MVGSVTKNVAPCPGHAFCPGFPAMAVNNAPDIGEPDAGPFKFIRSMEPLKDAEQFVGIAHIESYPIIADKHDHLPCTPILQAPISILAWAACR